MEITLFENYPLAQVFVMPTTKTHNFQRNSLMISFQHIVCSKNNLSTSEQRTDGSRFVEFSFAI